MKAALKSVATRINAMGGAAIRCSLNYEEADNAFAGLLNSTTGGVYS
ncbi:hypothetical protein [Nocardia salmonicida]|nr:hypothetical protein [Nocardia salmonicida]